MRTGASMRRADLPRTRRWFRVGGACLLVVALLLPSSAAGQAIALSPRVTAMGGHELSFSAGVRMHIDSGDRGFFASSAIRGVAQSCALDSCSRPGGAGVEVVGGLRHQWSRSGRARPFVSAGAGAVYWFSDSSRRSERSLDPVAEIEAGMLVGVSERVAVVLGARGDAVYEDSGSRNLATFVGAVGGVTLRVR